MKTLLQASLPRRVRRARGLARPCRGFLQTRRGNEAWRRVFTKGRHPNSNKAFSHAEQMTRRHQRVDNGKLRGVLRRAKIRRRLAGKTKPWVAALSGIQPRPDVYRAREPGVPDSHEEAFADQLNPSQHAYPDEDFFGVPAPPRSIAGARPRTTLSRLPADPSGQRSLEESFHEGAAP